MRREKKNACQHPRSREKPEIHTQTRPERHLPCVSELRSTSAAGSQMHNARRISAKSSREGEEGLVTQLLNSGFLFSIPPCCVWLSFGQKYPCLSLVAQDSPTGTKHNPKKTPHAQDQGSHCDLWGQLPGSPIWNRLKKVFLLSDFYPCTNNTARVGAVHAAVEGGGIRTRKGVWFP